MPIEKTVKGFDKEFVLRDCLLNDAYNMFEVRLLWLLRLLSPKDVLLFFDKNHHLLKLLFS